MLVGELGKQACLGKGSLPLELVSGEKISNVAALDREREIERERVFFHICVFELIEYDEMVGQHFGWEL